MLNSRSEGREHVISDTKEAQACKGRRRAVRTQYEIEHLDDVMEALKVAKRRISTQNLDDDIGKFLFPPIELAIALYVSYVTRVCVRLRWLRHTFRIVYESSVHVFGGLLLVLVGR
jgi:hypothetical protein